MSNYGPFEGMSAAEMENLRVTNPTKFAELEQQLTPVTKDRTKPVIYRNGRVVEGEDVKAPE